MTLARRYEITRLEAFSDAVFAFALTLLVVSLEAPRSYAELMQLARGFLPFAASFALLIYIWYEHSVFFSKYGLRDRTTTILNADPLKYLFTLTFAIVIPQLRHEGDPQTLREMTNLFVIYGLGFIAVFGVLALLYYWAWRRRTDIDLTPLEARDARGEIGTHLVSVLIGLISIAWAELAPGNLGELAGFVYFLMGPAHWVYGEHNGRRRQAFLRQQQSPPNPDAT